MKEKKVEGNVKCTSKSACAMFHAYCKEDDNLFYLHETKEKNYFGLLHPVTKSVTIFRYCPFCGFDLDKVSGMVKPSLILVKN